MKEYAIDGEEISAEGWSEELLREGMLSTRIGKGASNVTSTDWSIVEIKEKEIRWLLV